MKKEPIVFRDDITIKIDGGGIAFTLGARDFKGVQCVSYQKVTGCLSQGAHPGSYNGQDAYNDLLVVDDGISNGNRTSKCRNHEGGCPTLNASHEQPILMSDRKGHNGITEDGTATTLTSQEKERPIVGTSIVRRLTPLECERLQGFPSKKMIDVSQMTKDEYIAWNLAEKNIIADAATGKVYATRGPGGCPYKEPKELQGTELSGYRVVSIRNGATKLQCRVHRIIWISVNGIIPDGYVIDHINNDKMDNRITNLQLLTPADNSSKAKDDGLYKSGLDNKATKLDPDLKDEIAFLYEYSEMTMRELADLYGISKSRIAQIIHEVGWTDIGEWTDSNGKKHKEADSPRYKALGNSIAIPFWQFLARRICAQYERPVTLGSLFDGIGGFPLAFSRCGAIPVWASEIEEFPIAVTKIHFPEKEIDNGEQSKEA